MKLIIAEFEVINGKARNVEIRHTSGFAMPKILEGAKLTAVCRIAESNPTQLEIELKRGMMPLGHKCFKEID